MKDITIYETGNGGDFFLDNNDLSTVEILIQQIYISFFGGNVEASTKGDELATEKRFDWWANSLLFRNNPEKQFNSETEKTLKKVALNSAGRIEIERAAKSDLKHLEKIVSMEVSVLIINDKTVQISVALKQLRNKENKILQFLWDNAKKEIITQKII